MTANHVGLLDDVHFDSVIDERASDDCAGPAGTNDENRHVQAFALPAIIRETLRRQHAALGVCASAAPVA
jgi:hypothetical protein